jgi:hypothetical protein
VRTSGVSVEEGLRAWLRVLPPHAELGQSLRVADLASHLSADPLATVRELEREGLAELTIIVSCPECEGVAGAHLFDHEEVAGEDLASFRITPAALPGWLTRTLAPFEIVIALRDEATLLHRAVEQDAQVEAPPSVEALALREVRLRLGMGGDEEPLQQRPGREYLRLRFGTAVDLGADRRVIDLDAMQLLGDEAERREFRERLRRRLHGVHALPLVSAGSGLETLEQARVVAALARLLEQGARYIRHDAQDAWRALAGDWGLPPQAGRTSFEREDGLLLICACEVEVAPHAHAFLSDGRSVDPAAFDPVVGKFAAHAIARCRDLQERAALEQHLKRTGTLLKGGAGLAIAAVLKLADAAVPGGLPVPVDPVAGVAGLGVAGFVLGRPLARYLLLTWRLRSGSWNLPRAR